MTMNMKWMPVPMLRLKKVDLADGKIMRRDITVTREAWLWDGSETCYRCKRPIMPDDLVLVMDCGATTPRKIENLKKSLAERFETRVIDSVIQSDKSSSIQSGIESIINEKILPNNYDLSLIFQSAGEILVFLKLKNSIESEAILKIEENVKKYFDILKIKKFNIETIKNSKNPPTLTAILRSAKKIAPFLTAEIIKELEARSFDLPSEKWMNKQLDSARKKGLIFRRPDGKYVLTYRGVLLTPTTKNRNSSDVERVLYLANKKW